jgi:hypothetical protein
MCIEGITRARSRRGTDAERRGFSDEALPHRPCCGGRRQHQTGDATPTRTATRKPAPASASPDASMNVDVAAAVAAPRAGGKATIGPARQYGPLNGAH